jgi:hypothetical protein
VGIAAAIFYWAEQQQPLGLNVHATDSTSQVRIAWDKTSGTVRNARAGYVEIADGGQTVRVDLDANELQLGYVNYQRQSKNVTVRLVVNAHDGTPAEDLAQFVAPADQPAAAEIGHGEPSTGRAAGAAPDKMPVGRASAPVVETRPRASRKPHLSSGSEPPFTCSVGDVFRKTDAAPGWDTFTCLGKNVWSVTRTPGKL